MKLSNQAIGALMMALQKSLLEQTDIVPMLNGMDFEKSSTTKRWGGKTGELVVTNPPVVSLEGVTLRDNVEDLEIEWENE
jgi:hypothetical protein